ncbi:hypothetical protein H7B90_05945 [Cohnella xylanilytica]|uniref:Matrixin n=1 Tax=Cohnella xylanilytica TaxID=557555 RepID=A0A841TXS2_9BACL|nr:hypothetical protein [Cohnella xylanilytica]MBB6690943.1 hypothetical protein [Cohnella xylanilytica]
MKTLKSMKPVILAICITVVSGTTALASSDHYHKIGFGNEPLHLYFWKDSSVASYGYTSYANTGFNAWDGISDALTFHEESSEPTYGSVVTYVGNTIPGKDVYGTVDHWVYGLFGWTQVNPDDRRHRSRVRFDHTNLSSLGSNALRQYAFTHEFGHAVGLKHNNDSGVASVMRDDSMVASNNMPQPIDKAHIIEKYGD